MNNYEKKNQYAILMKKLEKATYEEYYYEAIFIEYAILEDRTESILRHAKLVKDKLTLSAKISIIRNNRAFKDKYIKKHITDELLDEIKAWKNERNKLIHNLVNVEYNSEEVKNLALKGECLARKLASKSQLVNSYNDKLLVQER